MIEGITPNDRLELESYIFAEQVRRDFDLPDAIAIQTLIRYSYVAGYTAALSADPTDNTVIT
jgi:hypothetical protein